MTSTRLFACVLSLGISLPAGAGCGISDLRTPERMDRGLVVVLPGIEGRSRHSLDLARGLDVWAYFNNDALGYAVENAGRLREILAPGHTVQA